MTEWFEDEAFWIDLEPFLFPDERMSAGEEEIQQILGLIDFHGQAVLDLCCGPGRHTVPLARRGFQVTAVSYYEQLPRGMCNTSDDCDPGLSCVPHECVNPYAPCYGDCK